MIGRVKACSALFRVAPQPSDKPVDPASPTELNRKALRLTCVMP